MKHSSLESSLRDESNGGSFISIDVIDKEPDANMSKIGILFLEILCCTDGLASNSASSDQKTMKNSSLESSLRDESNGSSFMSLGAIDKELAAKPSVQHSISKKRMPIFDMFASGSLSITSIDMKLPPLDSSRRDDSNELCFIFF